MILSLFSGNKCFLSFWEVILLYINSLRLSSEKFILNRYKFEITIHVLVKKKFKKFKASNK